MLLVYEDDHSGNVLSVYDQKNNSIRIVKDIYFKFLFRIMEL